MRPKIPLTINLFLCPLHIGGQQRSCYQPNCMCSFKIYMDFYLLLLLFFFFSSSFSSFPSSSSSFSSSSFSSSLVVARFCLCPCLFLLVNDGAKVRRQLSAYHIFPINSQPPLPTSKNGNFSLHKSNEVRKLRSVGASSPKLGAAASRCRWTPHKDKRPPLCKTSNFLHILLTTHLERKICCTQRHSLEEEEDFLTILLSVWM